MKERKEAKLLRPSLSSKDSFTSSRLEEKEEKEEKELRGKIRRRRSMVRGGVGVGILGGLAPLTSLLSFPWRQMSLALSSSHPPSFLLGSSSHTTKIATHCIAIATPPLHFYNNVLYWNQMSFFGDEEIMCVFMFILLRNQ